MCNIIIVHVHNDPNVRTELKEVRDMVQVMKTAEVETRKKMNINKQETRQTREKNGHLEKGNKTTNRSYGI